MIKITENEKTLKVCSTIKEAEHWLCYYLNHGHDAYIEIEGE